MHLFLSLAFTVDEKEVEGPFASQELRKEEIPSEALRIN
jgi:hypothetical protein